MANRLCITLHLIGSIRKDLGWKASFREFDSLSLEWSIFVGPWVQEAATWHAHERARLSKRGRPPSAADGQIAAIASVNDLIVVTANAKDFRRFKDLVVEDWSR
jgi:predicted nucleic acid-binding protein